MGYSTKFRGAITVEPPLNATEIKYLRDFADTRRMNRNLGPYFTDTGDDGSLLGNNGQSHREDIIDYNKPYPGDGEANLAQPGLWCGWIPTDDGTALVWNGVEKFYDSGRWMEYLIHTFLRPGCTIEDDGFRAPELRPAHWYYPPEFGEFTDHTLNGRIRAQGEDYSDRWDLVVTDNQVEVIKYDTDPSGYDEERSYGYDEKAWATIVTTREPVAKPHGIQEVRDQVNASASAIGHKLTWKRLAGAGQGGPEQWGRCTRCPADIGIAVDGFWTSEKDDPRSVPCSGF